MSSLKYYTFVGRSQDNFINGCIYVRYGDGPERNTGLYINRNFQLECLSDSFFTFRREMYSIKNAVCIFSPNSKIKLKKIYSIYKSESKKYYLLTEDLDLEYVNKEYFIDEEDWNKKGSIEQDTIIQEAYDKFAQNEVKKTKEYEELEKKQKEKNELEKKLKILKNIFNSINSSLKQNKTITKVLMPKRLKMYYYIVSIIGLFLGIIFKQLGLILFSSFFLVSNFILLRTYKIEKFEEYEIDINNYERLKFQNNLPLNFLGKIKMIENELVILNYKKIDSTILDLLQQSVNLTIYVSTNQEYYLNNKEVLDEKLQEFLDNTLEYIRILKENQEIESNYISSQISKNIIGMIDKNNDLFKSMIKDNHYLTDIYKEL